MNILLAAPSAIATFFLLWLISRSIKNSEYIVLSFYIGLLGVVSVDLIVNLLSTSVTLNAVLILLYIYYVAALIAAYSYLGLSMDFTGLLSSWLRYSLLMLASFSIIITLIPGAVLEGVQPLNFTYTRIAGPYYWVIQSSLVSSVVIGIGVLTYFALKSDSWLVKRKAVIWLISTLGLALTIVAVILFMQLGFQINALTVTPIAILILLFVQMYAAYEHRMFKMLSYLPFCSEYKLNQSTIDSVLKYKSGDFQGAVSEFEKAIIRDVLEKFGGNKSAAADHLKISRTTLRRKLEGSDNAD